MRRLILDTDVASLSIKQQATNSTSAPARTPRRPDRHHLHHPRRTDPMGNPSPMGSNPPRRARRLACQPPDAPIHRRRRTPLGRDLLACNPTRSSPPAERHMDRGLLPGLRTAPRDPERQGLRRLCRARGPEAARHLTLSHGLAASPARGAIRGANWCRLQPVEPVTPIATPEKAHVTADARSARAFPKPSAVGSSRTGGTQVRAMIACAECFSWSHPWSEQVTCSLRAAQDPLGALGPVYPPRSRDLGRAADLQRGR